MKEFIKDNFSVSLSFLLVMLFTGAFYLTREAGFSSLISITVTGFFALANHSGKPSQTLNTDTIENADISVKDSEES